MEKKPKDEGKGDGRVVNPKPEENMGQGTDAGNDNRSTGENNGNGNGGAGNQMQKKGVVRRAADWVENLSKIVINTFWVLVIFFFIIFSYHELSRNVIFIEPFEVPQELEDRGYNGKVIAAKIIDKIQFIRNAAKTEFKCKDLIPTWSTRELKVESAVVGISVSSIILQIKKSFGAEPIRISGGISILNKKYDATVRISGEIGENIPNELNDLENEILFGVAKYITKNIEPLNLAAYLFSHEKNEEECINILKYILSQEPQDDDPEANTLWGIVLMSNGDYEGAKVKFKKAIDLNPKCTIAYNAWGSVLRKQKKFDSAIEKYEKAIELDKKLPWPFINLGNIYNEKKEFDKAIEMYKKAVDRDPKEALAYSNWSDALVKKKDYDGAIEQCKRAIDLNPKESVAYINWGDALSAQKKYDEAIEKYEVARGLEPDIPDIYYGLGIAFKNKKDLKGALEKFQRAVQLDPEGEVGKKSKDEIILLSE